MGLPLDDKVSAEVLRQVEFYFSDSNLPGDKFLRRCVEESEDGLVSLPLICSFARMRGHLDLKGVSGPDGVPADVTAAVAEVLRKSSTLRVSEDGKKVGRVAPTLKFEEIQVEVDSRSVAAGPLRWNVTMDEVQNFFSQHAKISSVRLPRHSGSKAFCGYALIELASEEEVKKMLELKTSYDGIELEIKTKKDFDSDMEKYRTQQSEFSKEHQRHLFDNKGRRNDVEEVNYPKGLIVAFSLEKMKSEKSESTEKTEAAKEDAINDGAQNTENAAHNEDKDDEKNENQISWANIKDAFKQYGNVKYIDFTHGAVSGYLRFEDPEAAKKARMAAVLADVGGIVVKDHIATLEAVEGDAEKEYWIKVRKLQDKVRDVRGGRGGGRRGGRGRSHERRNNRFQTRQNENGKESNVNNTQLGKHQRFEDSDGEGNNESPAKHNKSEEVAS